MKNHFITFAFIITVFNLMAQNATTKKADQYFNQYEYVNAANAYLKLVDSETTSPYVYKQLAETYFNMFNTTEAAKWYAKATATPQDAETYYRYAQMLKANGKYEDSLFRYPLI